MLVNDSKYGDILRVRRFPQLKTDRNDIANIVLNIVLAMLNCCNIMFSDSMWLFYLSDFVKDLWIVSLLFIH